MKVIILCGGMGTRLQEETEFRPKPMVQIGNKPIIWHIMKIYAHYGHKDFILCLGYKGEMIKEYFYNFQAVNNDMTINLGDKNHLKVHNELNEKDWAVTLVDTGEKTLKGARLKKVEKYIDSDVFMLTYGDGVADIDISAILDFHKKHGKIGTVTGVHPPSRFGELNVNGERVSSFKEKPQVSEGWINGGFFVLNREFLRYLSDSETCDLEVGALEKLAEEGQLMAYKHNGEWACMDTVRDVNHLNKLWDGNKAFWKIWND